MHHKEHHGRKGEMEHHKQREHHKRAHHAKMAAEHAKHPHMHEHGMHKAHHAMMDNRHVNDNHQQGIERVKQRHGDLEVGQHGSMSHAHKSSNSFKRSTGSGGLTPRKA